MCFFMRKVSLVLLFCMFLIHTSFSQSVAEIVETLEIDTLLNNGSKDNRINFAFSNVTRDSGDEVYQAKAALIQDINELLTYFNPQHLNSKTGFSAYRNFFNIYSIWFPNPLTYEPFRPTMKNLRAFGMHCFFPGQMRSVDG